jgi:hypothetical protein
MLHVTPPYFVDGESCELLFVLPKDAELAGPGGKSLHIKRSKFNFLSVQCRIAFQDLFNACTVIQHIGNKFDGDSGAAIDRRTAHCLQVFDNDALCPLKSF